MIKSILYVNLGLPIQIIFLIWIYTIEPYLWRSKSLVYIGYNISFRNTVESMLTLLLIAGVTINIARFIKIKNKALMLFALELASLLTEFLIYVHHIHSLLSDFVPLSIFVAMMGVIPICVANIYIVFAARR